jgi:gamma-glutamyltranspeptidase
MPNNNLTVRPSTLEKIAEGGPDVFYNGPMGKS